MKLPLREQPYVADEDAPEGNGDRFDLSGVDVLLIEDDDPGADATRRLLESAGASVRVAASAEAARAALSQARPNVVLSDIGLPGENGLSLIRDLRRHDDGEARLPAIALSAFARAEDRQRAMEAGFDDHLAKPVDPRRLMALVTRFARAR